MGVMFDDTVVNDPVRVRQGCDLPASIDNYSNIESRQEMGVKLNTFLGTITANPHITVLMNGKNTVPRTRDVDSYRKVAPKNLHARTARNPYRTEVY